MTIFSLFCTETESHDSGDDNEYHGQSLDDARTLAFHHKNAIIGSIIYMDSKELHKDFGHPILRAVKLFILS